MQCLPIDLYSQNFVSIVSDNGRTALTDPSCQWIFQGNCVKNVSVELKPLRVGLGAV